MEIEWQNLYSTKVPLVEEFLRLARTAAADVTRPTGFIIWMEKIKDKAKAIAEGVRVRQLVKDAKKEFEAAVMEI